MVGWMIILLSQKGSRFFSVLEIKSEIHPRPHFPMYSAVDDPVEVAAADVTLRSFSMTLLLFPFSHSDEASLCAQTKTDAQWNLEKFHCLPYTLSYLGSIV